MSRMTALVLAGTRPGGDPMAAAAGVSHKALIEVAGRTMIERVVGALAGLPEVDRIVVAIERPELVIGLPVTALPTVAAGPAATVAAVLQREGTPLLVTTADNALLQTDWLREFLAACPADADVVAALARRDAVEAAAPHTRRTWLRFADGGFSGCNLFLLARPAAAGVIVFWQTLEMERKHPVRMMRRLGLRYALRYLRGRLTLAAAAERLGELSGGARVAFVALSDGRAAIDVDNPDDLILVRDLTRLSGSAPPGSSR